MGNWLPLLLLAAFLCCGQNGIGQTIGNYSRTVLAGQSFVTMPAPVIRTSTTLPAAPAFTGSTDDGRQAGIVLPFTFTYDGVAYTQAVMGTNGWLSFGADQLTNDLTPGNAFTTTTVNRAIHAWHGDGNANFGTTTPNGAGSMQWGADATGNRFVFQWTNASGSGGGSSSAANSINYQVVLDGPASATPGRVTILYGATTGTISTGRSIAIEDATGGTGRYINALNGLTNSTLTATAWPGSGAGYQFDPPPPCSGIPNPGATLATVPAACSGVSFTLSLANATTGTGVSYQWFVSTTSATGPWTPVGASTPTFATSQTQASWYYSQVSCATGTGTSASSSVLAVPMEAPNNCYCTATFTTVEPICLVQFAGINNATCSAVGCSPAYENFTAGTPGSVVAGQAYPIVVSGNTDGDFLNFFTAFFDWNQDGIFETTVPIGSFRNTNCVLQATISITVPGTALAGSTRMRIIKNFNSSPTNPCVGGSFGQIEDYRINVTLPVDCPMLGLNIGDACDDGNANTGNDTVDANCNCVGQPLDCVGVPGGTTLPGSSCDDGNPNTGNDV
ncbi:MAG: hypothetical protein C7N36_21930, partial [Bacteroidetes bacterium]